MLLLLQTRFSPAISLFDVLHTNLFKFNLTIFKQLAPHFEDVFTAYERSDKLQHIEARVKLLGLLYHLEEFALENKEDVRAPAARQIILHKLSS